MHLVMESTFIRFALGVGRADDSDDDDDFVRNTGGDFDIAGSDDEGPEDFAFGFQGGWHG